MDAGDDLASKAWIREETFRALVVVVGGGVGPTCDSDVVGGIVKADVFRRGRKGMSTMAGRGELGIFGGWIS
jgi:hypothetical protein